MSFSSDDVNLLIFRYLQESGAFASSMKGISFVAFSPCPPSFFFFFSSLLLFQVSRTLLLHLRQSQSYPTR